MRGRALPSPSKLIFGLSAIDTQARWPVLRAMLVALADVLVLQEVQQEVRRGFGVRDDLECTHGPDPPRT